MDFAVIAEKMVLSESMVRKYVMRALLYCRARLDLEADDLLDSRLRGNDGVRGSRND
jgi:DNA-directed RNA polymerase specialized sigma24 family protein